MACSRLELLDRLASGKSGVTVKQPLSLTALTSLCTTASERLLRNGLQNQMPLFL